jgi:hypothetical protein
VLEPHPSRVRPCTAITIGLSLALACASLALAGRAAAADVRVRFIPSPDATVIGYRAYIAPTAAGVASAPRHWLAGTTPGADGVLEAAVAVPNGTSYVALTAWDGANESSLSNVIAVRPSPPLPGALYWESFSGLTHGSSAPGFQLFDKAGAPVPAAPGAFRVFLTPDPALVDLTGAGRSAVYVPGALEAWATYELRGRMRHDGTSGSISASVMTDFKGRGGYSLVLWTGNSVGLAMLRSPEGRCAGKLTLDASPRTGVWYRFSIAVVPVGPSTIVLARLWAEGTPEPTMWDANCADVSLAAPRTGTIALHRSATLVPSAAYFDDLVVRQLVEPTCIEARSCDDGDPGTTGDVCRRGICQGAPCFTDLDCNDGDLCNGSERCIGFVCRVPLGPALCGYVSLELGRGRSLRSAGRTPLGIGDAMSASLWVRPLDLSQSPQQLLSFGSPPSYDHSLSLSLWGARGDLVLIAQGESAAKRYIYPAALFPGLWQHVGFTWDGDVLRLFVDGVELAPSIITDPEVSLSNVARELAIGASVFTPGVEAIARFGHVALFDRALLPDEVSALHQGRHHLDLREEDLGQGLVHYWRLGEEPALLGHDLGPLPLDLVPLGLAPSDVILDAP